jgi:hypothetical protein
MRRLPGIWAQWKPYRNSFAPQRSTADAFTPGLTLPAASP